jgi:hypothetical protein
MEQIVFYERDTKVQREGEAMTRAVAVPIGPEPYGMQRRVAKLLRTFMALKTKVCPALSKAGAALYAIDGDPPARTWTAAIVDGWLQTALVQTDNKPPDNFVWSAGSLRSGAASAAQATGAPMPKIRALGGWSKRGTTAEDHYIDPLVRDDEAARAFFGFLCPQR